MRTVNQDQELKDAAFQRMKDHIDMVTRMENMMEYAKKEGHAQGLAEGHAEGLNEGRAETIRKMVAGGVPLEMVANSLGLSIEEIKEIL